MTGRLTVKRNLQDLEADLGPGVPLLLRIIAQEVEDGKSVYKRQNRLVDQISSIEIAIIIDDAINRPPRFLQSLWVSTISYIQWSNMFHIDDHNLLMFEATATACLECNRYPLSDVNVSLC